MSYSEFVDSLDYGFQLFYNTLISISNMLLNNYIFITILGLVIFISLIYFLFDIINIPLFLSHKNNLDDKGSAK